MLLPTEDCTIQDIASAVQTAPVVTLTSPRTSQPARTSLSRDYLPALTGLRFWLALWVILHHICGRGMMLEAWANGLPNPIHQLIRGGYLAVQTFFILSGFVLARTYTTAKWDQSSLAKYFTARFARIYPVYFVSLIILSPFIIEMMIAPTWSAGQRATLLTNYLAVLQGWTGALGVGWNTPAWSLSCEFFFYLWFPVLFVLLKNARWRGTSVAMAVAVLLPIVLDHAGVPWSWKPIYNFGDFLAGIAAARILEMVSNQDWKRRGYWLYIPAIFLGGWLIIHPTVVHGSGADINTFLRPLNVMMLVGFALGGGWLARWLSVGWADFLGKASYSMYVLHVPILWWTGRYFVHGKMHPPRLIGATIYLALVVVASSLIYQYFEAPVNTWIRTKRKRLELR